LLLIQGIPPVGCRVNCGVFSGRSGGPKGGFLLLGRQEIFEDGGELFGEAAGFGDGFKLSINVLGVALLANAYSADHNDPMIGVDAVNHAMVSELVFPVPRERAAQRKPVALRVNGQLFVQNLSELIAHTAVESFDVRSGV
jgi:hypothetical protein